MQEAGTFVIPNNRTNAVSLNDCEDTSITFCL